MDVMNVTTTCSACETSTGATLTSGITPIASNTASSSASEYEYTDDEEYSDDPGQNANLRLSTAEKTRIAIDEASLAACETKEKQKRTLTTL